MPTGDTLTPKEAAHIATNAYFALKDWAVEKPTAGVESRAVVKDRVLGKAAAGSKAHANTSLKGTGLADARLGHVHSASTGFGTVSGFGYTLTLEGKGQRHAVIATRGTRPEMSGKPDLLTDLRGSMASFGGFGPVHKGFKKTFDSIMPDIARDRSLIMDASVIHCVGHSLGGGVATLIAAHYASLGKAVKLYTFGSPRVGCFDTYTALQGKIGKENIYRVAHDLDPITLIAPYPYIHVLPAPRDKNNMTLLSPTGRLFSTANHDMVEYIASVGDLSWSGVRALSSHVDHDNDLVARWLLHGNSDPGWVELASVTTLSLLFKLFNHTLKTISTSLVLSLSAVDLLAEILMRGLQKTKELGERILELLRFAATWAGIKADTAADFSAAIIKRILAAMLTTLRNLAANALTFAGRNILPISLALGGGFLLTASNAF